MGHRARKKCHMLASTAGKLENQTPWRQRWTQDVENRLPVARCRRRHPSMQIVASHFLIRYVADT
jgi:hypothetical protein